jgi:filamentous hemagglutinin
VQNATTEHTTLADSYDSSKRLLSTHTKTAASSSELTLVEGSSISGNAVAIQAGNDVTIQASDVNATNALSIRAGNDVNIITAQQLLDTSSQRSETKTASGLATAIAIGLAPALGHLGVAVANSSASFRPGQLCV